jgi:hypothetical protein
MNDDILLSEVCAAMNAEADAQFSEERLARQQARILQRIDQDGRPGRVIAFPAGAASGLPSLMRTSATTRWVAAAATVAFIVGVLAGHRLPHDLRFEPADQLATRATGASTGTTLHGPAPAPSDDEFLGEVEVAGQSRPTVLQHLDALTPRAWEVEVGQ